MKIKLNHDIYLVASSFLVVILTFLFFKPVFATISSTSTVITVNVNSVLSINSSGSVTINVTPLPSGVQSANSDNVSVSTSNTNGYTLQLSNASSSTTSLSDGSSHYILATPSVYTSPGILNANYWGFCSTTLAGFVCPSGPLTNQTISSSYNFAKVPVLGSPVSLKVTNTTSANDATTVWYAASLDTSQPSGNYTGVVMYTATPN
ncbi:MAG: hypothetical protein WCP00_00680 [bacterium]|jgi:hypothetical protein|nr:hypothetical protein [bacterium]